MRCLTLAALTLATCPSPTARRERPPPPAPADRGELLRACVDERGIYRYLRGGETECGSPRHVVWSRRRVPLSVHVEVDDQCSQSATDVARAVAWLDDQLGFRALTLTRRWSATPDVLVYLCVPDEDVVGWTQHLEIGGRLHAVVGITTLARPGRVEDVARHELGHVLGLAHDLAVGSIMYRSLTPATPLARLERRDRRLLRAMYR